MFYSNHSHNQWSLNSILLHAIKFKWNIHDQEVYFHGLSHAQRTCPVRGLCRFSPTHLKRERHLHQRPLGAESPAPLWFFQVRILLLRQFLIRKNLILNQNEHIYDSTIKNVLIPQTSTHLLQWLLLLSVNQLTDKGWHGRLSDTQ